MTGDYWRLRNEQLAVRYSSPNINLAIKSGRMKMAEHVAHMGGGDLHTEFWWGNLSEERTKKT